MSFKINPDITKAETLPATFYKDDSIFEEIKDKVFLKSWQWIGDENLVSISQSVHPFVLLDDYLTEPMLLTKEVNGEIFRMLISLKKTDFIFFVSSSFVRRFIGTPEFRNYFPDIDTNEFVNSS